MITKNIILCADDFSLNPAINAGIISLLEQERLSAVSCMVQSPGWKQDAQELVSWRSKVDIGLHLNLTHHFPNHFNIPLSFLMLASKTGFLPREKIRRTINLQLDTFENIMASTPDFIDGHQHVHIFPVVRDLLLEIYLKRYGTLTHKPWIRCLEHIFSARMDIKTKIIHAMGARQQKMQLNTANISHNSAFTGIYDFNPNADMDKLMQQWLSLLPDNGLIMCHPALKNSPENDRIAAARVSEYDYLSSKQFVKTLERYQAKLEKFREG